MAPHLVFVYLIDWGWVRIGPLYLYINIDPGLVHLGPLGFRWYGLMYVVGILICSLTSSCWPCCSFSHTL